MNFSHIGDFTRKTPKTFILFLRLITSGSEFDFSEIKLVESNRWRYQLKIQKTPSKTPKNHSLKSKWIFHILDFWFVNIKLMPRGTLSRFLQNLKGRSGNSPWIEIGEKSFTRDSEAKKFRFFVMSITYPYLSGLTSFFLFSSHVTKQFETIDVELNLMYSMLYIIWKHFFRWFQKYKIYWNLLNQSIFMTIYVSSGQNDKFRQKRENLITWRII